ncbi:hypothetical protein [Muricoccus aerilatus]|uniref:hypothetical protein n=1 Tax=Muricoccus aerilatus TaxID=452982 RepID=UPI0012EBE061|nr:hypothetical protein [Roseomonas aerilata]
MRGGDRGLDEVRIVVERGGSGANKWRWRLANDGGLSVSFGTGFRCAEDAYQAARRKELELRTCKEPERRVASFRR